MAEVTAPSRTFRLLLFALGIVFAALTIFYRAAWMYYIQRPLLVPQVEVGLFVITSDCDTPSVSDVMVMLLA